jgi:hypothetical protein
MAMLVSVMGCTQARVINSQRDIGSRSSVRSHPHVRMIRPHVCVRDGVEVWVLELIREA